MAIAKGRNNMLASIEDSASLLNNLVDELDRFYSSKLTDYEKRIELLKTENSEENPEVLYSMCSEWNYAICIYDEFFTETKEMLVPKVYSYAEKHLNEILSMLKCPIPDACHRIWNDNACKTVTSIKCLYSNFGHSLRNINV